MKTVNDSKRISLELSEAFQGKVTNIGVAVMTTAYVLLQAQKSESAKMNSLEDFLSQINAKQEVADVLSRNLSGLWETVVRFIGKYKNDALEAVLLYDNSLFDPRSFISPTPYSLIKLAGKILDIKESDSVLDLCSGVATFAVNALKDYNSTDYTGIEINYDANDIAILRTSLLEGNYNSINGNAFTYNYPQNYDKVFSNYPFALRGKDLDECRKDLEEQFSLDSSAVNRCSSDWLFNATIIRQLKETGRAVAIMADGATFNKLDMYMRQYFAEKGYIEAVINLPANMFLPYTTVSTTMMIFSHNNKSIKLVNAEDIYSQESRRSRVLSEENIDTILNCIKNGGENTIDLTPDEMKEHEYILMTSHYLEKPNIENGVCFESVIKSVTRGSQIKSDVLESYKSAVPTNIRYIMLSNVNNGAIEIDEGQQYIKELPKQLKKYIIPNNAIVLSKMASQTFRSSVVSTEQDQVMIATGNLYIIEIDDSKANPYFIQAFFDSEKGEATLSHACGGSFIKTISVEALKNLMIPLPSLVEQNRIAEKYKAAVEEYAVLKRKMETLLEEKRTLLDNEK